MPAVPLHRPGDVVPVVGSGLGLSIVRRIAEIYGATVSLDDVPGGPGLCVTVRFAALGT